MTRRELTTRTLRFGAIQDTKINDTKFDRTKTSETAKKSVKALAEAGAKGQPLTPAEVRAICEALRSQPRPTPTQFHGSA